MEGTKRCLQPTMDIVKRSKQVLLSAMMEEMRSIMAGQATHFSDAICRLLELLPIAARRTILNSTFEGWYLLAFACKNGLVEMTKFLCQNGADPELKRCYFPVAETDPTASLLWFAAVQGNLEVAKVFIQHGADVNSASDTGITVLHAACLMTHLDLVDELLEHGADTLPPNISGDTCLMNSVQWRLLCEKLLQNGANIDAQNNNGNTALHLAIEHKHYDTAKLLIERGADLTLINSNGDDALRLASIMGSVATCEIVSQRMNILPERLRDIYKLLGAAYVDHDFAETVRFWKESVRVHQRNNTHKKVLSLVEHLGFASEFLSTSDIDCLPTNPSSIKLQSLLIYQRILGATHPLSRLYLRSFAIVSAQTQRYCDTIPLLMYSLELTAAEEPIIFTDMHSIVIDLSNVFSEIFNRFSIAELRRIITCENALKILTLIGDQISALIHVVSVKPSFIEHEYIYNYMLHVFVKVLNMVLLMSPSSEQKQELLLNVGRTVSLNPRTIDDDGFTLLHLALTDDNYCSRRFRELNPELETRSFTNYSVVQVLLECKAPVLAYSSSGLPPLYSASFKLTYTKEVVQLLLSYGAHPDQVNSSGETALEVLEWHAGGSDFKHLFLRPLKCLAACVVRKNRQQFPPGDFPCLLEKFVAMHSEY